MGAIKQFYAELKGGTGQKFAENVKSWLHHKRLICLQLA
jgi:predicted protein tyrosine phosphatase